MSELWDGSYFLAENSEMAKNSNENWIQGKNGSNFEPFQSFQAKKSEPSQSFDMWCNITS